MVLGKLTPTINLTPPGRWGVSPTSTFPFQPWLRKLNETLGFI